MDGATCTESDFRAAATPIMTAAAVAAAAAAAAAVAAAVVAAAAVAAAAAAAPYGAGQATWSWMPGSTHILMLYVL